MTEDYQGSNILPGGLDQTGMDGLLGVLGVKSETPAEEPATSPSDDTVVDEAKTAEPEAKADEALDAETVPDPDDVKRNQAFAEMRAVNAQYKKFLSHLMKGASFQGSEEDFIEQLTNVSYEQQAKTQNVAANPELLKRLDTLEQTNTQLIEAQNKQMFVTNIESLSKKFNLSQPEVREFIQRAVDEKIDLTIPGTNFATLYQGLFFDKIKDKLIENERQSWIVNNTKANSATSPDGKSGTKDPNPTNVNTMAEFNSLLQNMNPNK